MKHSIKLTDLLNPEKFDQHKEQLSHYFEKGGTWKELLGYDDQLLSAQYKYAYELYQKADYKNAAAAFSYLTLLNPYDYNFWMGLGISKQADRFFEEAIVSFVSASAMNEKNPTPHLHLAQCFYKLNVREMVIDHLKQAISIAEENPEFQEIGQKATAILNNLPK